jgi:hypothetical protein
LVAAIVLTGCSNSPDPQPSASGSTSAPATTSDAPITEPPATPAPTYTPPPSRNPTRPPGVRPVKDTPCDDALTDAHFYDVGFYGALASFAEGGSSIPEASWVDIQKNRPNVAPGIAKSRAALTADGVPTSYLAWKDMAALERALNASEQVIKKRDETKVLSVYYAFRTAEDRLLESCSALEK